MTGRLNLSGKLSQLRVQFCVFWCCGWWAVVIFFQQSETDYRPLICIRVYKSTVKLLICIFLNNFTSLSAQAIMRDSPTAPASVTFFGITA